MIKMKADAIIWRRKLFVRAAVPLDRPLKIPAGDWTGSLVHVSQMVPDSGDFDGVLTSLCEKASYSAPRWFEVNPSLWDAWEKPNKRICLDCVLVML